MASELEPSEAVRHAKRWFASVYSDEKIANIGLEEVRWEDGKWEITIGFDRLWDPAPAPPSPLSAAFWKPRREYKVVVLSGNDNAVIEMRNREAA